MGSVVNRFWALEYRLSCCGAPAYMLWGMWNHSRSGIQPLSLALAGRFLTTEPQRKPYRSVNEQNCFRIPLIVSITPSFNSKSHLVVGLLMFWLIMIHHSATSLIQTLSFSSLRMSPPPSPKAPSTGEAWVPQGAPGVTHMPHLVLEKSEKEPVSRHRWRKFTQAFPIKLWNIQSVLLTQPPLLCSKSPEFFHPSTKIL